MLGIPSTDKVVGRMLWEILPPAFAPALRSLFESEVTSDINSESGFVLEKQFSLDLRGQRMEVLRHQGH